MKKMIRAITLSLSTLIATSAIASPQHDPRFNHQSPSSKWDNDHRGQDSRSQRNIKPARDWKAGQTLPRQFNPSNYAVSYKDASRLYKPNKNQQWLKINGDYVLINERNHKIVKIIA